MAAAGAVLAGLLAAAAAPDAAPELALSCQGRALTGSPVTALGLLARGGLSARTGWSERREEGRVLFRMSGGAARVHLPPVVVTAVNSGGEDGWWPVQDLKVTDDAITGRLRLNIVNHPGLRIDRISGDLDLGGAYPFHGACEKAAAERKF